MSQFRFTAKDILEKEFKTSIKGYNQDDVDKFLDAIIQDYEKFHETVERLEQENQQLRREVKRAQEQKPKAPTAATSPVGSTNYDILQRLSNLEKEVFGRKLYE
ncbi:cell division regulator GpsB [Alkalihalobacterium chitinilyticum]|uniref:Cell cycle protein GpsB n=1 Tax=Alkalihalobacterium chitinilyticum TaxID=2980103 RepID=A0ABT5VI31_9BACI|nr:cell division regulator GpsB [Alkalihalobacterium chitinilyticum]MDE5414402.1 cell division regulator GpsB [Alkalihalobacterium chitinilyticum]